MSRPLWRIPLVAGFLVACGGGATGPADADDPGDPPGGEPGSGGTWTLVWQDEFDGSTLDPARWEAQIGDGCDLGICGWGNEELQWYSADNAVVGGGLLTITAEREANGGKPYTSARIRTAGRGDWTYARVEIRARMARGQGMWSAIWMLPTDEVYGGWAASGEIDIVEHLGHEPATVYGTLHHGGAWPANVSTGDSLTLAGGSFSDDFHVFALEWEAGEIRWYVDGELYQTQTRWSTPGRAFPAPFDQRFHLLINLAVGGTWPGNPDATTTFPQTLEVDWVRVYQRR